MMLEKHLSNMTGQKTVENIVNHLDPRGLGELSDLDDYHYAIANAAYVLRGKGLLDWTYHTQWSGGATLWDSPTGNGTLKVDHNGRLS